MTTDLVGKRLGDFAVVRELGRGGMGVVYEAVQMSLNRRTALKVLGPGLGLAGTAVDRFRREAAAAARLHHTNIVPVYTTGEAAGLHFYAMEFIDGPSLDRVIRDLAKGRPEHDDSATVSPSQAAVVATGLYPAPTAAPAGASGLSGGGYFDAVARMVADVADALHHAHTNGVVHRDVKPSNLLLSPDGRLSVNDFGLARLLEQPGLTTTGEFLGTPAYMAPEQIAGGRIPVDHRCDVYSLGATLYELLTLGPPFTAERRDQLLALVVQKEPVPPRAVDPRVPRDLETVCLKCLEKDPDRRYQTARELADDLRRFVNRFAIRARRSGPLGRLRKWVKRNPALAGAGLAVLLALAVAGLFAYRSYRAEQREAEARVRHEQDLRAARRLICVAPGPIADRSHWVGQAASQKMDRHLGHWPRR